MSLRIDRPDVPVALLYNLDPAWGQPAAGTGAPPTWEG